MAAGLMTLTTLTPAGSQAAPAVSASASAPDVQAQAAPDLTAWCGEVLKRVPKIPGVTCASVPLRPGDGRSVRGTPLWTADLPPAASTLRPIASGSPLRVMVIGGIHGDEAASVSLVLDWITRAGAASASPIHWRFTPLVNPDGLLRRPSTRVNARGVDLNRNFPTADWAREAPRHWIERTKKDPRRYPGRAPVSEPESRWVQRQMDTWQPNLIVSVHAPYGVLDFDGPPPPPYRMGSLILDQVGVFPGSLGNYGGVLHRVPVVTLELHDASRLAPNEGRVLWDDLNRWIAQRLLPTAPAQTPER